MSKSNQSSPSTGTAKKSSPGSRRRYAAVGIGGRIPMFIDPILDKYRDNCEVVGICDTSTTRMAFHQHCPDSRSRQRRGVRRWRSTK
jgi:hypothetical protein